MKATDFQIAILSSLFSSQIVVIPAFIISYVTLLQCKSVDGLTNLALMVPWYGYVLAYLLISLVTFYLKIWSLTEKQTT